MLDAVGGADVTRERAVIAVQGPEAAGPVGAVSRPKPASVERFHVTRFEWRGTPCTVAGTGYTGEDGVEVSVAADKAADFWRAALDAGITPAGLGARDTLRLEAGLPLHGHELGPGITPLQAGLGWVVGWSKPMFRGKAALEAERALPARAGVCAASPPAVAARPAKAPSSPSTGPPPGLSPAATTRPCSATASPWPSSRPTPRRAPRWASTSGGGVLAGQVVPTPFVKRGSSQPV